jgi:hypothetical protein
LTRGRAARRIRAGASGLLGIALAALATAAPAATPEVAHADHTIDVDGWQLRPELGARLAVQLAAQRQLDGLAVDLGVDAYASHGGAMLYVTWLRAREPADEPALRVRRAFDELRAAPQHASPLVGSAEIVSWRETVAASLAEGQLVWRHLSNETETRVRALMWMSPDRLLRQVRAECVLATPATSAAATACDAALGSLRLTIAAAQRGALGVVPGAGSLQISPTPELAPEIEIDPAPPPDDQPAPADVGHGLPELAPPTQGAVLYQAPPAPRPARDQTLLYVGGAMLLVLGLYLVFRQRGQSALEPPEPDGES